MNQAGIDLLKRFEDDKAAEMISLPRGVIISLLKTINIGNGDKVEQAGIHAEIQLEEWLSHWRHRE